MQGKMQTGSFHASLKTELKEFLLENEGKFPKSETLKIDLHCHDYNSDVPDELLGRILKVPETWLKTNKLFKTLEKNSCDVFTVTNHNNARSCFEQKKNGKDVLVGAEFSCTVPDFQIGIHVLTYGFNEEQEIKLNKLRKNLYRFLEFAFQNNIPTIWAHPLYHYSSNGIPPFEFFEKLSLVFERFEILNGQRDTWQNILIKTWLDNLTPEKINKLRKKHKVDIDLYCTNPYKKSYSGGSDSHMGIFAGQTGTYLHVADLNEKLKTIPASELALEAIREGKMLPYGTHQNSEKMTIAFLDYVFQLAMFKEDPGLLRILLHKGTSKDKIIALLASNAFSEIRRHKVTMRFVELFHKCFIGKMPRKTKKVFVPKDYKPVFNDARKIANAYNFSGDEMVTHFNDAINSISFKLNKILFERLSNKIEKIKEDENYFNIDFKDIIENLEIPSDFRILGAKKNKKDKTNRNSRMSTPDFASFLDGLSFPFLASGIIMAANFISSKVLYNNRPLLTTFAKEIGKFQPPKRILWLTDTFNDKNGVSMVLNEIHKEIKRENLSIDIMVCSDSVIADDNLIVLKPMAEFTLPFYENQSVRIPYLNEIHNLFLEKEYDRIICSTEGIMGLVSLYLKKAYSVPASFYIHTDWVMFVRKVLNFDKQNIDRVRRFLRTYYKSFDNLFVLNTDHHKWLTSDRMGFSADNIHLTAHWVDNIFTRRNISKQKAFGLKNDDLVILFAGRLSYEKGISDIIEIYPQIKEQNPAIKFVFAGTGPAEKELKDKLPEAVYTGWIDSKKLPDIYSSADLLLLPSKFDTFSCVVLEALSCGLPVVAYKSKGPKDIIINNKCGFLVSNKTEMTNAVLQYFEDKGLHKQFCEAAIERSKYYNKEKIMNELLNILLK